jgi:chromosome segregation ATPase
MSFTDLMSSSRGPGVVGTLAALLVLVGFGTLYMFVFDESLQGGQKTIEAVIRDQETEINGTRISIANFQQRMKDTAVFKQQAREVAELESRAKQSEQRIATLTSDRDAALAAEAEAKAKWESYKDAYRESEWAAAKGEKIDKLTTVSGKEFNRVIVKEVSHKGIDISHEGGLRLIPADDLPPEMRDRFQFDSEKTAADAAATAAAVDLHSDNVEIVQLATKANDKLIRVRELEAKVADTKDRIKQAEVDLPNQQMRVAQYRSAIAAERNKKLSRAPEMEVTLRRMQDKVEETRRSIPAMNAEVRSANQEIQALTREVAGLKEEIAKLKQDLKAEHGEGTEP